MVIRPFHPGLLDHLNDVHQNVRHAGIEEFARYSRATYRTVYRWHQFFGPQLHYYPSIAYAGLGLFHVHLFIENGTTSWTEFPYAVQALWTNHGPADSFTGSGKPSGRQGKNRDRWP